jgi:superfamily II DNA or RNA helicase
MEKSFQERATALLRQSVGNPQANFRAGQLEAIEHLLERRGPLLVVQRTGWGKSNVYFIAAKLLREQHAGPTLIISPLLALMRNQIAAAERAGVRAMRVTSEEKNREDWPRIRDELLADRVDVLLVAPERLGNEEFVQTMLQPVAARIGLLVVDEAHCISDCASRNMALVIVTSIKGSVLIFCVSAVQKLNIELEQQHVAVFHDVFLAFHPIQTFFARGFSFKSVL